MPTPSHRVIRAGLSRPRVHAVLLLEQIRHGQRLLGDLGRAAPAAAGDEYLAWHEYNQHLLRLLRAGDATHQPPELLHTEHRLAGSALLDDLKAELRALESVATHLDDVPSGVRDRLFVDDRQPKVLVVHGRNVSAREAVARFLMKLGLRPILLDEQAGHGRTLIEKLEGHAPASFAVVLLTGDDVGALASDRRHLRPRARQNVIFELAFSIAHLGRERVCALYEDGVELPSDFRGVEYQPFDGGGAWKSKLARELHAAGLGFDPLNLL